VALDNLGQLFFSQGDLAASEHAYREERAMQQDIVARNPKNASVQSDLAQTDVFYARVAAALGHDAEAQASLETARRLGEALLANDPGSAETTGDLASYYRRLGRLARLDGDLGGAAPLLARAQELYTTMLALSPDNSRGRMGLGYTVLEQARLAWKSGDGALADTRARDAAARFETQLREHGDDRGASLAMADAQWLLGTLADARGQADAAKAAWSRGLAALSVFGADSNDPDQLATQAQLLHALGRHGEAQPLIDRLAAMGYRDAEFIAWADSRGAAGRDTVAAADPRQ
jgi:tetratricopeptide (TPR) repeat protein